MQTDIREPELMRKQKARAQAGETQSYFFEVDRGIGTYQVEVEEFTESIEVKLIPMGQVYDPKTISYGSIFIELIVIIIILWYARARKF